MLGFLVDALEGGYQSTVLRGAADAAAARGVGLTCLAVGVLDSDSRKARQRNVLLDLVDPARFEGLLVLTGSLANAIGPEALLHRLARLRIPLCSIAVALPNVPSVIVDDQRGMQDAMHHLLDECGCRRVAFVRGPVANVEAERRFAVYRRVLQARGISLPPGFVAAGDFSRESGEAAVRVLWDEAGLAPEAIVVADDNMALGVLDGLLARGIDVPREVAVVGFDDIDEARFAPVPLTTVRQPLYEQGARAVEALLEAMDRRSAAAPIVLPTQLVRRRSSHRGISAALRALEPAGSTDALDDVVERTRLIEEIERAHGVKRLQLERWARCLAETTAAFAAAFDETVLLDTAVSQFPRLGIRSAYLAKYVPDDRARADLILAHDLARPGLPVRDVTRFDVSQLLPADVLPNEPRTFVVQALAHQTDAFGFVMLEYGPTEGIIYETLRDQIGAALEGARLVQEVMAQDRERQRLLAELEVRAFRLQRAYDALREGQQRMLVSETLLSRSAAGRSGSVGELLRQTLVELVAVLQIDHALVAWGASPDGTWLGADPRELADGLPRLSLGPVHGRFAAVVAGQPLDRVTADRLLAALDGASPGDRADAVALRISAGDATLGVVVLERPALAEHEIELAKTLLAQAALVIQSLRLHQMATYDPLTGTRTRRFLDAWLPRAIETALAIGRPLTALMIDMDGLKRVNDTQGHHAGDDALAGLGRVLRQATREHDVLARYGGDEFAVILAETDAAGAEVVARRVLSLAAEPTAFSGGALGCSVGASTLVLPADRTCEVVPAASLAEALLRNADAAQYAAKRQGGRRLGPNLPTHAAAS